VRGGSTLETKESEEKGTCHLPNDVITMCVSEINTPRHNYSTNCFHMHAWICEPQKKQKHLTMLWLAINPYTYIQNIPKSF